MSELRSSIDLGTNTCLLLLAQVGPDRPGGRQEVVGIVDDRATVVRLGQGVDQSRRLHPDAKARTLSCLKNYLGVVRAAGLDPSRTICVATSQARDAEDGAEFFAEIARTTGFKFRTLSGDEEARATFRGGLLPGMDPRRSAVVDLGGGSTEFMSEQGGLSLDIGSVRFTERFFHSDPVTDAEFWECQDAIDSALARMESWRSALAPATELVAVAGTATTLAAYHLGLAQFDRDKVDRLVLTRGDLHRQVEELKWRTVAERRALAGVDEGRADVLLAGATILWRATELLRFPEIHVSTRGLRFGVITE